MIQKEKLLLKGASKLTKIALFSEPNAEIFPASDIFVSGDAVDSIEFVSQILVMLQTRAEPFLVVIPKLWELLLIFFYQMADLPYILLTEIVKKFPGDANLTVLRYMH